jgi:glycosyltransferase involved in cell wall biosynthesis
MTNANILKNRIKLDLVVSTYNNPKALSEIISLIETGTLKPDILHIADDGSAEDNVNLNKDSILAYTGKSIYHWHEDKGFRKSKILNQAIRSSKAEYIVFLDGDCLPHHKFIQDHQLLAREGCFIQGRRCFVSETDVASLLDGETSLSKLQLSFKIKGMFKSFRTPFPITAKNQKMKGIIGCNWGIWRKDLIRVNGFDEAYEGWGREDSDLAARLYNRGISRIIVRGRCLVYHLNHKENKRDRLFLNDQLLGKTTLNKRDFCSKGLNIME